MTSRSFNATTSAPRAPDGDPPRAGPARVPRHRPGPCAPDHAGAGDERCCRATGTLRLRHRPHGSPARYAAEWESAARDRSERSLTFIGDDATPGAPTSRLRPRADPPPRPAGRVLGNSPLPSTSGIGTLSTGVERESDPVRTARKVRMEVTRLESGCSSPQRAIHAVTSAAAAGIRSTDCAGGNDAQPDVPRGSEDVDRFIVVPRRLGRFARSPRVVKSTSAALPAPFAVACGRSSSATSPYSRLRPQHGGGYSPAS